MLKVLVGSRNPVKIAAAQDAFRRYFEDVSVEGIEVSSGVPAQPVDGQTFEGAHNRAAALKGIDEALPPDARAGFYVGLEGGMISLHGVWFSFGAVCVLDRKGRAGYGTSGLFPLPPGLVSELLAGIELGDLIDRLAGEENTKRRGGAVGYLTSGVLDRRALYAQGLLLALIPFLNEELYP